ncbi:hypothetical protein pmac_cds_779 [Pandoravirus macleodensis]|uniref:Uncharacterized protein n=1 Tax=Pandoravirus macleodensis TaxID=2107707 RepID=A0A2U7UG51_9VIRU|nr:hypothetical protein pmac_cds_779 [Pandoravirus macleodensis]AVK77467.1 hypothetical protein pmac_cds_779 [Pandoravirus macleodensis]
MPVRVTEQRRRSGSLLSPSSPETSSSSPAASPSVSRSSSSSSSSSPTCSLPSLPSSPVWAPSLSRRSSTDLPSTLDVKMEPTKQPDGGLDVPEHHGDAAI